ncbi:MAG TPA: GNAT family N-acetyltransferase [Candidatus Limnocylindria bacterium]|nr:GNAT family N-acetyltransferase [Candidatus Limnocylindria bacterium]
MTQHRIRRAEPAEADALRALAHRSKAHWPYDAAFLERVAPMLMLTAADVERHEVHVLEVGGQVAGWHRVTLHADRAELEDLWLEPAYIGGGWGRRLFQDAAGVARAHGAPCLEWDAEPYAQPFYERMGGVEIGRTPSAAEEGRTLPRMRLTL